MRGIAFALGNDECQVPRARRFEISLSGTGPKSLRTLRAICRRRYGMTLRRVAQVSHCNVFDVMHLYN